MKTSLPTPRTAPSRALEQRSLLAWALLLLPCVAQRGFSLVSVGAVALWLFCAGVMAGRIGRQDKISPPVLRQWDNLVCGWFLFVCGVGLLGVLAFPLLETYRTWIPLWWLGVAVLLCAAQIRWAARALPSLAGVGSAVLLLFIAPFLVFFNGGILGYCNGAFDFSPLHIRHAVVLGRRISRGKGGPSYYVLVRLRDGRAAKLRVRARFYQGTTPGQLIEVRARTSALGAEWFVEAL